MDGLRNTSGAVQDLMDQRARSTDGAHPHPLIAELLDFLADQEWIEDAAVRMRDQGQVFHVEVFLRPSGMTADLAQLGALAEEIEALDWKLHDVVVAATDTLPGTAERREAAPTTR